MNKCTHQLQNSHQSMISKLNEIKLLKLTDIAYFIHFSNSG